MAHAEGDAAAGEKVFAHCAPCHSTKPGENKLGPSLAGVFGRKSGTEAGYAYSPALKGQNITWEEGNLNEWLQGPSKFVKGTKMIYSVPDAKDRQDVIAYLKTLSK
ncbi:MAG TPA: cytochrome c family protein [Bradyrhizobium sp.]|nr:cytochrome c family protein [Bradyrhizobium sp.]